MSRQVFSDCTSFQIGRYPVDSPERAKQRKLADRPRTSADFLLSTVGIDAGSPNPSSSEVDDTTSSVVVDEVELVTKAITRVPREGAKQSPETLPETGIEL